MKRNAILGVAGQQSSNRTDPKTLDARDARVAMMVDLSHEVGKLRRENHQLHRDIRTLEERLARAKQRRVAFRRRVLYARRRKDGLCSECLEPLASKRGAFCSRSCGDRSRRRRIAEKKLYREAQG